MRVRSRLAKGTMLETAASKSKSKPSTEALPKGRRAEELGSCGPKVAQIWSAAALACCSEVKPPSVYVAPPMERRIVLPFVWQVFMSSLRRNDVSDRAAAGRFEWKKTVH